MVNRTFIGMMIGIFIVTVTLLLLDRFKEVLSSMGLRLGMENPGWPPENIEELVKKLEQEF